MKHKSTPLIITAAVEEFAIEHGAYFVENEGWFVDGEVPIELEEFVIQEQRIRDYVAESQEKINFEPAVAAKKPLRIPDDLRYEVKSITIRACQLFRNREDAMNWLESGKVSLQLRTPVEVMTNVNGCRIVAELLEERFK